VAAIIGNHTHNEGIARVMLDDYDTNGDRKRDLLLIAASYRTAVHRKYGDPLEPSRRLREALDIADL